MTVEKVARLYEGKAKVIYQTNRPDQYVVYFKDDATAFDGLKKAQLRDKGSVNNTISAWIFDYLEKQGIRTHYIEKLSDREMLVHKVSIIPVEVVLRNKATGSITKRLGIPKGTPTNAKPASMKAPHECQAGIHDGTPAGCQTVIP